MTAAPERRRFLACLSDPSRFSLVTMLAGGPRCVTELASLVGLSQSCTTRHLQALLRESIVVAERRGKRVVYALRREGREIHPVLRWACATVESPSAGAPAPMRSRRRMLSEISELEPDSISNVAVEHESGWVRADETSAPSTPQVVRDPTPLGPDAGLERRAEEEAALEGAPMRSRTEMDDFLL